MDKHAVPENIMDFEFKLVGGLTVRQFTYLAVSFASALVFYFVFQGLPIVGYPLIFISVILGLSLAFMKINEQPFAKWFSNFLASTFSSQRKVYKKETAEFELLSDAKSKKAVSRKIPEDIPITTAKKKNADAIVDTSSLSTGTKDINEEDMNTSASRIDERQLKVEDIATADDIKALDDYFGEIYKQRSAKGGTLRSGNEQQMEPKIKTTAQNLPTPKVEQEKVTSDSANQVDQQTSSEITKSSQPAQDSDLQKKRFKIQTKNSSKESKQSQATELQPNQIAGFVTTTNNQPVSEAEVNIVSNSGENLAQSYTNSIGKFIIPTSLGNGKVKISIQKSGYKFPNYELELKGEKIPIYKYQTNK